VTAVSPAPRLTRGDHLGYALGSIGWPAAMLVVGALPRPVAERLLAGVLGRVYRPSPVRR
jgi:hypothetical protein